MYGGNGGGQFYCLKGSKIVTISLTLGTDSPINSDALITAGKTACGRMS